MGLSMKDIFKKDEETLVIDKKKQAIKTLIMISVVILLLLILVIIIRYWGNVDETRRKNITRDIINVRNYVTTLAAEVKEDPGLVLPGTSLEEQPVTLNINGFEEEYRYGYYLLTAEDLSNMATALNITDEQYIVNYDTADVVNVTGIRYKSKVYHSIDDLVAIENGEMIPSDNTIIIKTPAAMAYLLQYPSANFKLAGNIDMSGEAIGENWTPVKDFKGKLDGRGYTISNLVVEKPSEPYIGLFANIEPSSVITNINFDNPKIIGENYTGVLAGTIEGDVRYVTINGGTVKGESFVGGLAGSHQKGKVSNCMISLESVDGREQVGGVVGALNSGTISETKFQGKVYALDSGGGIAGRVSASNTTYLYETCANVTVAGTESLGGIIGKVEIISKNLLEMKNCYAVGTITEGEQNMGGLIGYARVTTDAQIVIDSLYAAVNILEKNATSGGCIGLSNISAVASSAVNVFWEKNIAVGEVLNSVGTVAENSIALAFEDKTSEAMRLRSTYTDWNFDVWAINERVSTPYLKFEIK